VPKRYLLRQEQFFGHFEGRGGHLLCLGQIPAEGIAVLLIVGELVEWFESVVG
jgi:hypothetical protein